MPLHALLLRQRFRVMFQPAGNPRRLQLTAKRPDKKVYCKRKKPALSFILRDFILQSQKPLLPAELAQRKQLFGGFRHPQPFPVITAHLLQLPIGSARKLVNRAVKKIGERAEHFKARGSQIALPFGDSCRADAEHLRQLLLRKPLRRAQRINFAAHRNSAVFHKTVPPVFRFWCFLLLS